MAMTANKKFWTEFIDIYHSLPSLWNTKDENYNNRESRSEAWNKLVVKLREVEPDANQDSVKRKINTFRSNFNREVRKIRHTQKEQPTELYNPTLWYFEHLSFLLNQEKYASNGVLIDGHYDEEITMSVTTAKNEIMVENETMQVASLGQEDNADKEQTLDFNKLNQDKSMLCLGVKNKSREMPTQSEENPGNKITSFDLLHPDTNPLANESIQETQPLQSAEHPRNNFENMDKSTESEGTTNPRVLRSNSKRLKLRFKSQDLYRRHFRSNSFSSILTDEADIYGQSWACGFRKLNPQQKLFAKKAIDDILILGQLKALKLNTVPINSYLLEASDQG